ncbi:hypothetical protein ARHIZOSPH14_10040 [Agromyces rhizosphaerae]|uniref:SDR-like Ig domain-containing protein n=2 Tax=Agromyces rhizosphaerae TaxID=88374 RepID=A0A9W6FQL9_9MICO|nr:hypothetical protein ARHIZOSPH14_10040 [Agromyces rhizosphaerae]
MDRRSVVKAAAWSVPAVAVAASVPAYAASTPNDPCIPATFLDGLEPGTSPSSISFFPSTVMASLSYASSGQGGDSTPGSTGQVAATSTVPPWNYIEIEMVSQLDAGDWVELTITLSVPVVGLSFTLHDIDWVAGAWYDSVSVTPAGYTPTLGANVQGTGTAGDPFRPIGEGDNPISSGLGDVRITYPLSGPVSQVVIHYQAGITGNSGNQHIGLGDLSFENCPEEANLAPQTLQGTSLRSAPTSEPRHQVSSGTPKFVPCDGTEDT